MQQFIRASTTPEQIAAGRKMSELTEYYAPMIPLIHPLKNDFVHPWVKGFYPMPYVSNYWKYLDIDLAARP
jgi:ABC-type transport system substrate-binding protein